MVRATCVVQLTDTKRSMDLMLGFNETLDLLPMANSVHLYAHEERGWSCVEYGI